MGVQGSVLNKYRPSEQCSALVVLSGQVKPVTRDSGGRQRWHKRFPFGSVNHPWSPLFLSTLPCISSASLLFFFSYTPFHACTPLEFLFSLPSARPNPLLLDHLFWFKEPFHFFFSGLLWPPCSPGPSHQYSWQMWHLSFEALPSSAGWKDTSARNRGLILRNLCWQLQADRARLSLTFNSYPRWAPSEWTDFSRQPGSHARPSVTCVQHAASSARFHTQDCAPIVMQLRWFE